MKYQIFDGCAKRRINLASINSNKETLSCDKRQAQLIINALNRETGKHYIMKKA